MSGLPPDAPRPSFEVRAEDLSEAAQAKLQDLVDAHGGSSEVTTGNLGGEVGAMLVGAGFWLGAAFNASQSNWSAAGIGVGLGLLLVAWGGRKVKKRFASSLGSFEILTEAFLVLSDGGQMRVFSLAHFEDFELEHLYRKGIYQRSIMKCRFVDGAWANLGDHLPADVRDDTALEASATFRRMLQNVEAAKSAQQAGRWRQLEGADLFLPTGSAAPAAALRDERRPPSE